MALPYPTKVVLPFDIATAQDMNERHANDVALAAGTGLDDGSITPEKLGDSGWINCTLENGWAAGGVETPRYRRIGGVVYFDGSVVKSATAVNQTVFTLPVGFRPSAILRPAASTNDASPNTYYAWRINSDGTVNIYKGSASGTFIGLPAPFALG